MFANNKLIWNHVKPIEVNAKVSASKWYLPLWDGWSMILCVWWWSTPNGLSFSLSLSYICSKNLKFWSENLEILIIHLERRYRASILWWPYILGRASHLRSANEKSLLVEIVVFVLLKISNRLCIQDSNNFDSKLRVTTKDTVFAR